MAEDTGLCALLAAQNGREEAALEALGQRLAEADRRQQELAAAISQALSLIHIWCPAIFETER